MSVTAVSGAELEQEPSRVQRPEGSSARSELREACLACGVAEANFFTRGAPLPQEGLSAPCLLKLVEHSPVLLYGY